MDINIIWKNIERLRNTKNYLYGDGWNATHMYDVFTNLGIPVDGFIRVHTDCNMILGIPVVELDKITDLGVNILITQSRWQDTFDMLLEKNISLNRIYIQANVESADECFICGSDKTMQVGASFAPFLKERMFENESFETNLIHCCNCGIFYAKYRPSDIEMDRLYSGYRDEKYQKQRQKYEPDYTKELNARLSDPISEANRKKSIFKFIAEEIDLTAIDTVLDWGGIAVNLFLMSLLISEESFMRYPAQSQFKELS